MKTTTCPTCGSTVPHDALSNEEDIAEAMYFLGLTKREAALFVMLWRARGRVVTHTAFLDVIATMSDKYPEKGAVMTAKKRLAQSLKGTPLKIINVWGVGYRLERLEAGWEWKGDT